MTKIKRELLRDDSKGKLAGVCAGVADYFGWELWLVRVVVLSSVLLGFGGFLVVLYFAGWLVLEKKSVAERRGQGTVPSHSKQTEVEYDKPVEVKTRVWQRGESARQALIHLRQQFDGIEQRIRLIETHVTSNKFQLEREFNRL